MSKEISKLLSLVLRHTPERLGIVLDNNGWASIDDLTSRMRAAGYPDFDRAVLEAVMANSEKKRFTISADGQRVRAAQGHSIEIDLGLQSSAPPAVLFHGTAEANLTSIKEQGLVPGRRQHVHLSKDWDTAITVGQRHGRPVVLTVDTKKMADTGFLFYRAENGVWLTDMVPPEFLSEQAQSR